MVHGSNSGPLRAELEFQPSQLILSSCTDFSIISPLLPSTKVALWHWVREWGKVISWCLDKLHRGGISFCSVSFYFNEKKPIHSQPGPLCVEFIPVMYIPVMLLRLWLFWLSSHLKDVHVGVFGQFGLFQCEELCVCACVRTCTLAPYAWDGTVTWPGLGPILCSKVLGWALDICDIF